MVQNLTANEPNIEKPAAQHLTDVYRFTQRAQDEIFKLQVPAFWPLVRDLEVHTPKFAPEEVQVVEVFADAGGLHIVFADEVFPFSKRVDESYRASRILETGRAADVESVRVLPDVKLAFFPWTSSLPNLIYETGFHGFDVQPWTGKLYRNTWNGMLSTFPNPLILLRGGYVAQKIEVQLGSRKEAEAFAVSLL